LITVKKLQLPSKHPFLFNPRLLGLGRRRRSREPCGPSRRRSPPVADPQAALLPRRRLGVGSAGGGGPRPRTQSRIDHVGGTLLRRDLEEIWTGRGSIHRMAGGDVYRSGPPHIPSHHCFLSTKIDQGYRRHGRSHHRSRMLIHLVRHAVPSTLLQLRHRRRHRCWNNSRLLHPDGGPIFQKET
jgi:hypothetical protein